MDLKGWDRKKAVLINLVGVLVLSMPCVLGYNVWSGITPLGAGSTILDLEDFIVSNNLFATWKSCLPAVLYDEAWMGI